MGWKFWEKNKPAEEKTKAPPPPPEPPPTTEEADLIKKARKLFPHLLKNAKESQFLKAAKALFEMMAKDGVNLNDEGQVRAWIAKHKNQIEKQEKEGIQKPATYVRAEPKVGRNNPCHCGSGLKYKRCHGA